jgi:hypothetical protein
MEIQKSGFSKRFGGNMHSGRDATVSKLLRMFLKLRLGGVGRGTIAYKTQNICRPCLLALPKTYHISPILFDVLADRRRIFLPSIFVAIGSGSRLFSSAFYRV